MELVGETAFLLEDSDDNTNFPLVADENLETLSKCDLIELVKEERKQFSAIEIAKRNLQTLVESLEKTLEEQTLKCKRLQDDKSLLRDNIRKASSSWFQRKAQLSESESEQGTGSVEEEEHEIAEVEIQMIRNDGSQALLTEEAIQLFSDLKFKREQLELSEKRSAELSKRLQGYETLIDDQEVIIHGLEKQLETYFNDNKKMSKQLADLHKLFADLKMVNEKQVQTPGLIEDPESSSEDVTTEIDFKDVGGSVSKTYTKLKELIYEKKSLVTEIERLKTLNIELQLRVSQQETRLISVSEALQTTWLLVSNLKDEHAKLHTAESILRYELREKREILQRLREELECSREQWHSIRQKNAETEQEWNHLREELTARKKLADNRGEALTPEEIEGAIGGIKENENEFEPPIDLLVDMGIEYGIVNADDEEPTTAVSLIAGEDVEVDRLQNLEEQCCLLYQKLMTSTARALNLASRLSSLHEHYTTSDGDDEEEEEYSDEDNENMFETQNISPDSDSYDTAYVSEVEGADSGSTIGAPAEDPSPATNEADEGGNEEGEDLNDDNCDVLSRRLITFLPKKIAILKVENKKLEERLAHQQEERTKMEESLNATIELERRQRKQLEDQLSHLGKCVDELKLERNGKIEQVEEELRKKVEQVEMEEKGHIILQDEFESLKNNFEQREQLLQTVASQLQKAEIRVAEVEEQLLQTRKQIEVLVEEKRLLQSRLEMFNQIHCRQSTQTDASESTEQ